MGWRFSVCLVVLLSGAVCFGRDESSRWALQGVGLSAEEAQKDEASLAGKPNNFEKRAELLGYYRALEWSQPRAVEARKPHLLWLVEREPESDLWLEDATQEPAPAVYQAVKERWLQELAAHPNRPKRIRNAAAFLLVRDRAQARELLAQVDPGLPRVEELAAKADALTMLHIEALDLYGLPWPRQVPGVLTALPQAQQSASAERQCATAQALLRYGASGLTADAPARGGLLDLVNTFMSNGIGISAWAKSCESGAETVAAWRNLQSAGWLPSAAERDADRKLAISKDLLNARRVVTLRPVYPEFAKSRHITGAVLCRVRISKDGQVAAVEPLSGARELAASAVEAIKGWRFTVPAEVVTVLELRYTMQ